MPQPTLRITCPDPDDRGLWCVETPDGERLRGASRVEITLDAEHGHAVAVVTFIGVHVDVHARAERHIELIGVDKPFEPGEAPDHVSEATLPTEAS
jgi:hypothetical protein